MANIPPETVPESGLKTDPRPRHHRISRPSDWVVRWAGLVREQGRVLDIAAGAGRNARVFLDRGHPVTMVDRDISALDDFAATGDAEVVTADLEDGSPWPFSGQTFACVLVNNYLHRPLLPALLQSLEPGGVLIYETFARGNEAFTRPRNPDHLLKSGELINVVEGKLQIVAFEHGLDEGAACPGVIQRICAVNDLGKSEREDKEPAAHKIH